MTIAASSYISSRAKQIWTKLKTKAYRRAFVSSHLSTNIAAQIFAIREAQQLTQKQLADRADMAQARIALLEDPNYQNPTISTLKRIADACDVALIVRFVPFSELVTWATSLNQSALAPTHFEEDALTEFAPFSVSTTPTEGTIAATDTVQSEREISTDYLSASNDDKIEGRVVYG